jgi:TetR/AcrR family transcriptional regulator, regulator of cefoperazone and chloramphenicol sensitivity
VSSERAPEDLTARARIRDAAIALFADRGIGAATVRDIAHAAGVSSGLLRHHFGSKDGLRDACDEYAMAELTRLRARLLTGGHVDDQALLGSIHPAVMQLQRYLVRSTMDGSAAAAAMYDRMVAAGEEWLRDAPVKTADPRAYSATLVAMQMGMFLLRDQLSRAFGDDVGETRGHARMLRAAVEIFTQPLLTPDQAAETSAVLDRLSAPQERP